MGKALCYISGLVVCLSCFYSCENRTGKMVENQIETVIPAPAPAPVELKKIDTVVNLSFAGYALGSAPKLSNANIIKQSSITPEKLTVKKVNEQLVFSGYRVNAEIELYSINDTICMIKGLIESDIYKVLVDTYVAKYGEPTLGILKDVYNNDTHFMHCWRFTNQEIRLQRRAEYGWNLDARPMRQEYKFKYIQIQYEDCHLASRYNNLWAKQEQYERSIKPTLDSIAAAKAKAEQDSLHEIERQRLLKDAHQI